MTRAESMPLRFAAVDVECGQLSLLTAHCSPLLSLFRAHELSPLLPMYHLVARLSMAMAMRSI